MLSICTTAFTELNESKFALGSFKCIKDSTKQHFACEKKKKILENDRNERNYLFGTMDETTDTVFIYLQNIYWVRLTESFYKFVNLLHSTPSPSWLQPSQLTTHWKAPPYRPVKHQQINNTNKFPSSIAHPQAVFISAWYKIFQC